MTEQQTFQQGLGQSTAIDRQEQFSPFGSLRACSANAISSLPVPLAPVIRTVAWSIGNFFDKMENIMQGFAFADDIVEVEFHTEVKRSEQAKAGLTYVAVNVPTYSLSAASSSSGCRRTGAARPSTSAVEYCGHA
jgi:hypothetical protein